jgi:hypothetical protein
MPQVSPNPESITSLPAAVAARGALPVPVRRTEVADVLDRAVAHIESVGWFQGDLYDNYTDPRRPSNECPVCAIGALNVALHGTPRFPLERQPDGLDAHDVADIVKILIDDIDLADWNDAQGRTQKEVTALLREAAAELRRGESQ